MEVHATSVEASCYHDTMAMLPRKRCFKGRAATEEFTLLPALMYGAADAEAWCYHNTAALLRRQKAVLPSARPCYQGCSPVLPAMSVGATVGCGCATSGGCRCYDKQGAVLPSAGSSAKISKRCCYKGGRRCRGGAGMVAAVIASWKARLLMLRAKLRMLQGGARCYERRSVLRATRISRRSSKQG